ncbi:hypothetical protein RHMOL_Rhmol01G0329300 [Rhododendron molle]|uniref:Uncharacterized protein n=1 Tax=Rhododendron molle TaxID=49168 RepID=A0ACC0Q9I7_RHOML|nr:hypothetical protein RHMOL_Rhmol01G0329300 [Rhododendron molle]
MRLNQQPLILAQTKRAGYVANRLLKTQEHRQGRVDRRHHLPHPRHPPIIEMDREQQLNDLDLQQPSLLSDGRGDRFGFRLASQFSQFHTLELCPLFCFLGLASQFPIEEDANERDPNKVAS